MVDGEQRRDRVEHPRRVEGRDKRQEMPVGIREPGNSPGGVDRPMLTHGEDGSARSDRDDDIAGAGTDPERGAGVIPSAGRDTPAVATCHPLPRTEHPGERGVMAERGGQQIAVVAVGHDLPCRVRTPGIRRPVPRARGVRPVRDEFFEHGTASRLAARTVASQPPRQPIVRECDCRHSGCVLGFVIAQPPELRDGERGDRHETRAPSKVLSTEFGDEIGRRPGGPGVVPQQRGTDDATIGIQHHHAVLLTPDRPGSHIIEAAGCRDRLLQR